MEKVKQWLTGPSGAPLVAAIVAVATTAVATASGVPQAAVASCVAVVRGLFGW